MKQLSRRTARLSLGVLVASVCCFAMPAAASAATVTMRLEGLAGPFLSRAPVTLPLQPVAPAGAPAGETCPGDSVVAAVDAATQGNWSGTWDNTNGWSLDRIETDTAKVSENRRWLTIINDDLINTPPCLSTLNDGDTLTLYPACLNGTTTKCFGSGPLELEAPSINGPGNPINTQVWEIDVTLNSVGDGTSQRKPSLGTLVYGPDNSTYSDSKYGSGIAIVTISEKGPATIYTAGGSHPGDHRDICITDGQDGFCGTTQAPQVPFDPLAFCQTTGSDGYCGSPDHVPPVGHITLPGQAATYKGSGPAKFTGTVDFDPSQTDHVDLRLVRQTTVTVRKLVRKRKVWVTRKVHGKRVRKRVIKKTYKKVKQKRCGSWSDAALAYKTMKTCNVATGGTFPATGADVWEYDFLSNLPKGFYTLDCLAVDGAGNVDSTPELGRNRVTFTVG